MPMKVIEGNIVDIHNRRIFPEAVVIEEGKIESVTPNQGTYHHYIAPGFIDAHVHIESSMLTPVEFSRLVIKRGTVAVVSDPHEIANVLGKRGVEFMIADSRNALIKIFFTIPSCVPATPFDCSGGCITSNDVHDFLETGNFVGLSEVMNVPGVLNGDAELIRKIEHARQYHLAIDGHAPGLSGEDLQKYVQAGISTDHECTELKEALEKIGAGMKILVREGSAARNYENLKSLIVEHSKELMFCTDDSHPDELIEVGHIDKLVKRAIKDGFDLFDVWRIACMNPIKHYGLNVGMLREGDPADFVIFEDLEDLTVKSVYIGGVEKWDADSLNKFQCKEIHIQDLSRMVQKELICIEVADGEIVTRKRTFSIQETPFNFESDIQRDILKIVYLNRYADKPPQVGYIHGVGLQRGAFASSVSHDSHNIIAVGCSDEEIASAINRLIAEKGGLVVIDSAEQEMMPLPIAGIISDRDGYYVAGMWKRLMNRLVNMACRLSSPFMTLSFMALIVIPELKIGEEGLFEYSNFRFISSKE